MKQLASFASLTVCALILGACASTPNPKLEQVRSSYQVTKQDPDVARSAPQSLRNAKDNIDRAQAAFEDRETAAVEHYAGLAQGHLDIAQEQAEKSRLEKQVEQASERRRELRLRAQRLQTIDAQREASSAQQAAAEARQRAAELENQLRDLQAERTERGIVLTLGDVLFDTDRAALKPEGFRTVDKLADFLAEYTERRVKIEGHTDSRGSDEYNQDLSRRRALSVSSALVGRGISPNRITTVGLGEAYPKASNDTSAGRQLNRRVEIIISDQDGNIKNR